MENILPNNWMNTEFGQIIKLIHGYAFKSSDYCESGVPIIRMSDIDNNEINITKAVRVPEKIEYDKFIINNGDILIGMSGSIGKYGIFNLNEKVYLNQRVGNIRLRSDELINKKLIYYYIGFFQKEIIDKGYGGAVPNISAKEIEENVFPLPPLAEQERIVVKLDALFAQQEIMEKVLSCIPAMLKDFRQQVLTQAMTGKLTESWREGKNLEEWKKKKLSEICISISDGDHQSPPKSEEGIPFLVISDISSGKLDLNKSSRNVPEYYYNSLKDNRKPKIDDILYTVTGSFGIPVLVDTVKLFSFQRHIGIIRPDKDKISPLFLYYYLKSELAFNQARSCATGTAQLTVPLNGLRNFDLQIPHLSEQQEIVSRVESLFARAEAIEQGYKNLKKKLEQLPQALLHKAFKGELVEQLPTDGDAKDLLKEIMALKNDSTGKKKVVRNYKQNDEVLGKVAEEK